MKTGPRYKIAKRLGATVFEKAQTQKFAISAERSAKNKRRGRGRQSEYGKQMLEKQKVRVTYGLPERQFRSYVHKALAAHSTKPSERLHELLELRLDNIIWRLGLVPTRRAARQMVAHGHVQIGGKKTRVPSYAISVGDRISVREVRKNMVPSSVLLNGSESGSSRPGFRGIRRRWKAVSLSVQRLSRQTLRAILSRCSRSIRGSHCFY